MDLWRCRRIHCMPPPDSARVIQECVFLFSNHTIGSNGPSELPCTQLHHMENNLSLLKEMHIQQQNHWKDILFYWYRSYHWYQIGPLELPCTQRDHIKYNPSPLYEMYIYSPIDRASDISWKKKQNFAGFSGANSRKNRPISRDFRWKKVKIR